MQDRQAIRSRRPHRSLVIAYVGHCLKAYVCGRLVAGVAGSNPAEGMDICRLCFYVVLSCVGRGLCDGLITRPEESYRMCQLYANKQTWMIEENVSSGESPKDMPWQFWHSNLYIPLPLYLFLFSVGFKGLWAG
jgi:hypothetical protein